MSEKSEAAARMIIVTLEELVRIAEDGELPMLAYMLTLALEEAKARHGSEGALSENIVPLFRN